MIDIQKECDELTVENQDLVKRVISALLVGQRNEKLAKVGQDVIGTLILLVGTEQQRSQRKITKKDYDLATKALEEAFHRDMEALKVEQKKQKPKPDMGR